METEKRNTGNVFDWGLLKRILGLAKPYRVHFIVATVMAVLLAVLAPVRPALIQRAVDNHILQFDYPGLVNMVIILIAVLMTESLVRYGFTYITNWLGQHVIKDLRVRVFKHLINLKLQFFDKTPIGTATTRTVNDIETINNIFSQGIITILADLMTLAAIIIYMFYEDWRLALVSLATFPIMLWGTYIFKEKIKVAFQKVRTQVTRMNTFLQEHISGMRIVQIFNAEQKEMDKFNTINTDHKKAHIQSIWYYSLFFPFVEVILASALGLMVWYGAHQALRDPDITIGLLIAFILYLNMAFRPLRMLADKFNTLQMGIVASDRVFRVLDTHEHIKNEGTKKAGDLKGDIVFNHVWFAYNDEDYVLKDIDFHLKPGHTLALVGATGAGKSSIINILNRFYEINRGEILVDGHDFREYDLHSLRSNIGLVWQDVFLFSGSVMDNITLYNDAISKEQVVEAAKVVGAHDFIMRLPGGYDYKVMERGGTLSMGQRQLISFLRTLVYDPNILILDEATSSVDTESELLIQNAIEKLVSGRTSIIIAHRLSTIRHAEKIIVLDKGEIKEMGTHDELMEMNGYYKRLHDMQFKKTEVA